MIDKTIELAQIEEEYSTPQGKYFSSFTLEKSVSSDSNSATPPHIELTTLEGRMYKVTVDDAGWCAMSGESEKQGEQSSFEALMMELSDGFKQGWVNELQQKLAGLNR